MNASAKERAGWRGYIFSREIDGNMIPQRVQNLVIRNYCQNKGIEFLLSAVEYLIQDSWMMLKSIYEELDSIEGVIFYSLHMLPKGRVEREELFRIIFSRGCGLHFALEEMTILNWEDTKIVEDIFMCKDLLLQIGNTVSPVEEQRGLIND